jgi:hypothetical protein
MYGKSKNSRRILMEIRNSIVIEQEIYIRKDALLEWLESKIKDLPKRGFVNCVATLSYKDVVEHINEM